MSGFWSKIILLVSCATALTLSSCLKEEGYCGVPPVPPDPPDYPAPLTITFVYDRNTDGLDKLREQVRHIDLFIFDGDGNFYRSQPVTVEELGEDNSIILQLPEGDYTAIAWGNSDASEYTLTHNGKVESMQLSLDVEQGGVVDWNCENLFHGIAAFSYDAETDSDVTISLCKNTNTINIIYEGIDSRYDPYQIVEVTLHGSNGAYAYDNSIPGTLPVTYVPILQRRSVVTAVSVVQRITEDSDIRLVSRQDGYVDSFLKLPVIDLIKEKYTGNDFAHYLDIEDTFTITVKVAKDQDDKYIVVSIKVNDWDEIIFGGIDI